MAISVHRHMKASDQEASTKAEIKQLNEGRHFQDT